MGLKLSTGLRNAILAQRAQGVAVLQGATGALVDGGAGADTITDSDSGFLTAGFEPGMMLFLTGCTTAGNDTAVTGATIVSVVAGTITLNTGIVHTAEVFAATATLVGVSGGSFADLFRNGVMDIYSGAQPASADAAETGTKLMRITEGSGAFVAGAPGNGLRFAATCVTANEITKDLSQVWSGVGLAAAGTGTVAGYFRLYANDATTGLSTSAIRMDGNCSMTAYPMRMSSTTIVEGATVTVDSFVVKIPAGS